MLSTSSAAPPPAVSAGVPYLALIYLNAGQREGLRRYESLVRPVFHPHGGRFEDVPLDWYFTGGI